MTRAGFPRERGLLRRILPWLFAAQEWAVVRRSGAVTFSNNHPRLWHLTLWHCLGKLFMLLGAARQDKSLVSFCRDIGHCPSDRSAPWDPARAPQSAPRGVGLPPTQSEDSDPGSCGFPVRGSLLSEIRMWSRINDIRKHFDACIACSVFLNLTCTGFILSGPQSPARTSPLPAQAFLWFVGCGLRAAAARSFGALSEPLLRVFVGGFIQPRAQVPFPSSKT